MKNIFKDLQRKDHKRYLGGLDVFRYIGPGLLVTVGFIDPGNWASNFAAGSEFGYSLLWVVTLSTVMLIILQHNVAHLGIVTGLVPVGSRHAVHSQMGVAPYIGYGGAGFHIHFPCRNIGRGHRTANAAGHPHNMGFGADHGFRVHNAFHQLLQED